MSISYLSIEGVRNLRNVSLNLHERYNFFIGDNGSGKTSLLEAIYLLGTARSFRTHLYNKVVNHEENHLTVFGKITEKLINSNKSSDKEVRATPIQMGVQKEKNGETQIKIDHLPCRQSAQLAIHLPLQLYYPDSFKIIDSGPKIRREVLDWGVFHVKHDYFKNWSQYQRILKQRNAWLRGSDENFNSTWNSRQGMCPWDKPLSEYAEIIHQMRLDYFQQLLPILQKLLIDFFGSDFSAKLSIQYAKGWGKKEHNDNDNEDNALEYNEDLITDSVEHSLNIYLNKDRSRDIKMGYTHHGPHKADIIIQHNGRLIKDVFSRGQQKLVIIAIKLAQGLLLSQVAGKECIYLLDDICAEFDEHHLKKVMNYLEEVPGQVFFTGIHEQVFHTIPWFKEGKVFHVKQGEVSDFLL